MMRDSYDMFQQPERGRFGDNEQHRPGRGPKVTGASDLVDLNVVHHIDKDRPLAILVSFGDRTKAVWLPRSKVEWTEVAAPARKLRGMIDQQIKVAMPEWLAVDKGFHAYPVAAHNYKI